MSGYGVQPIQLLEAFDKGCGAYSTELKTRNPDDLICPPVLLPGEKLILQQDKVTCVKTFIYPATGALHLTNYRIIFSGKYLKDTSLTNQNTPDELSKLGYKYQEERKLLSRVPPNIKKFVTLKRFRRIDDEKRPSLTSIHRSFSADDLFHASNSVSSNVSRISIKNDKNVFDMYIDDDILLTIPLMSILEVKKYSKKYLSTEKLQMLNDGIEMTTSNYMMVKFCLAEEDSFDAEELIEEILKLIKIEDIYSSFAFIHANNIEFPKNSQEFCRSMRNVYRLEREIQRLDLLAAASQWKEKDQTVCSCYPSKVITPKNACSAGKLKKWSKFYTNGAYPIMVWNDSKKKNVLLRSGSTKSMRGESEKRCIVDEEIILSDICRPAGGRKVPQRLAIYVEKPAGNTINLNAKKGEGLFYPHCEIITLENLPDLSSTHQCALKLQAAIGRSDESRYLSSLEESGWLRQLEILLDYALCIAAKLSKDGTSVLLSVGSGCERVAQISSLVQILMDPYYRTLEGFQVLIQKEWISIKYPFQRRNFVNLSSSDELSPLFLQFLDCVWQLTQQFPTTFEIGDSFLELLAFHSYSARFGTFIDEKKTNNQNVSLWTFVNVLMLNQEVLCNFNYDKDAHKGILQPTNCLPQLKVWTWFTHYKKEEALHIASMCAAVELEKLQRKYLDLLERHSILLDKLSKIDELSDKACNSIRVDPNNPIRLDLDLLELQSTLSSDENGSSEDCLSPDSFSKMDTLDCIGSAFYVSDDRDLEDSPSSSAVDKLKVLSSDNACPMNQGGKFHSLKDYLSYKDVHFENLRDVAVFKMMVTGYLVKQGGNYKNWKKRFFVIDFRKKYVAYFETSMTTKPKGVISYLNIKSVLPVEDKKHKFQFDVETRGRTYHIRAPSKAVMNVWLTCLTTPLSSLVLS